MKTIICTLFEGQYHYGVGVLVNSLYKQGFRGDIYAGYKGDLPPWAAAAKTNKTLEWENAFTLSVAESLSLHFLPLTTDYHLTNFKPDFMLMLLSGPAKDTNAIFYYDPDIVQVAPWSFMEEWVQCGIAVCEDVNSPLAKNHPRRIKWQSFYSKFGHDLVFKSEYYVNGGFIGVTKDHVQFIYQWKSMQEQMGTEIGGLHKSMFFYEKSLPAESRRFYAFDKTDQDALNATIEASCYETSCLDSAAMGFTNGSLVMAHAIGSDKPWKINLLKRWLIKGSKIKIGEKLFWNYGTKPIKVWKNSTINRKKGIIKLISFFSRFYGK